MAPQASKRPSFVGSGWAAAPQGYRFLRSPPAGAFVEDPATISEEWPQLLGIFSAARSGDLEHLTLLPDLIQKSEDFHLRVASLRLLGDASPASLCPAIAQFFTHDDLDTRLAAYAAAACTANLDLARRLVEASRRLKPGLELNLLADSLSQVLEREPDQFVEPGNLAAFAFACHGRIDEIESRVGRGKPVMFGELLDVRRVAGSTRDLVERPNAEDYLDLAGEYLLVFEAMTGLLFEAWFDEDGNVDAKEVSAAMKDFDGSELARRFVPGERFFFGSPVLEIKIALG